MKTMARLLAGEVRDQAPHDGLASDIATEQTRRAPERKPAAKLRIISRSDGRV
jgi:hypothetical protein